MRIATWLVTIALASTLLAGCRNHGLGKYEALCSQRPSQTYASVNEVPVDEWIRLLLEPDQADRDCTGKRLVATELPARCSTEAPPGRARTVRLEIDRVIVRPTSGGFGLIWIPRHVYPNDDQSGLIALVHTSKRALSAVGLGVVRLPADEIDLKLASIRGEDVLLAQGAECSGGVESSQCSRVVQALLLHQGRFFPLELRNTANQCTGAAEIYLAKSQDVRLRSGGTRRFELSSTYEVVDEGLLVSEQLVAIDMPSAADIDAARVFRNSEATRRLDFSGAYFVYDEESLWAKMREIRGDLQPATRSTGD